MSLFSSSKKFHMEDRGVYIRQEKKLWNISNKSLVALKTTLAITLLIGLAVFVVSVVPIFASTGCPPSMVSYWKLDDGNGTTATDSVDANNGTLFNAPTWTVGQVNGALDFDGFDDYVRVPTATNLNIVDELH